MPGLLLLSETLSLQKNHEPIDFDFIKILDVKNHFSHNSCYE